MKSSFTKHEQFLRQVVEFFIKRAYVTSCRDGCDVTFSSISTGYFVKVDHLSAAWGPSMIFQL